MQTHESQVYNVDMNILVVGSSLFDAILSLENNSHIAVVDNRATFSLGDKIPIDIKSFAIGGNAPNVVSALTKLSVPSEIYTYLASDPLSAFIKTQFEKEGIKLYFEDTDSPNGPLSLIFDFASDRTIFSSHPEFSHGFDANKLETKPSHIYLTSIGPVWEDAYEKVLEYSSNNGVPIAFSPGSSQMKNMNDTFVKVARHSKMLFCNMEEARLINQKLTGNWTDNPKDVLFSLKSGDFELLSITDGGNGAYGMVGNGSILKVDALPTEGHEKTGAGDAYAGAFLAAYIDNKSLEECMKWGALNAAGVMSKVGAHTGQLKKDELEEKVRNTNLPTQIL